MIPLGQVLTFLRYPSLLESSDVDGGSSVAVLTYLRRVLEALDHPDMIHLILHYLLALPESKPLLTGSRASVSAARKRKSMDLATIMAAQMEASSTPALFNLVDLIQGSLKSENQQTISVTLQLVSAILRRHHRYAVSTLLWTSHIVSEEPQRTIGAHEKEMDFLLGLAGEIGTEDDFDVVYENHVKDCMNILESHPCSITLIAPKSVGGVSKIPATQATIPGAPRDIRAHTLRPEDPMLKTLLAILSTFFTNSVETNLSLTGTIVDLAACGFMRMDGWLVPEPSDYRYDVDEEEDPDTTDDSESIEAVEKAQMRSLRNNRRIPTWDDAKTPDILKQLRVLVDQVSSYRAEIPRFDDILQRRRDAFQAANSGNATPIPVHQPPPPDNDTPARSRSPAKPSALDSLAQRIFDKIDTPSRSGSPRGRTSNDQKRSSGSSNSGVAGWSTPSGRGGAPPPQFPMGLETPSRGPVRAFSPSPLRNPNMDQGVPASQAAAFAAVDQSILARRVGLPSVKGEIEPIPFPKLSAEVKAREGTKDEDGEGDENEDEENDEIEEAEERLVSVSHVLTNILVLQEFLLELAALVQVRAGLFGEIRFV